MSPSRLRIVVMGAALCLALPASASAQAKGPAARAIATGQEGIALFKQGSFDDALAKFQQADAIYHSPVFVLYEGRSLRGRGRWVEALATLRRVAAENLAPAAPPPWKQAQADALRDAAALAAEIPSVVVTVRRGSAETQVTIDGSAVAQGERIDLDPGPHRIVASDGDRVESQDVTLPPGTSVRSVVVAFPQTSIDEAPKPSLPTPTPTPPRAGAGPTTKLSVPGLALGVAGMTVVVAGGVVGVLALTKASAARAGLPLSCDGTSCLDAKRDEIEASLSTPRRLATVADVLFITGGLAVAVGVYLIIVNRSATPGGNAGVSSDGRSLQVRF